MAAGIDVLNLARRLSAVPTVKNIVLFLDIHPFRLSTISYLRPVPRYSLSSFSRA
jgi:hypothetical protein